MINDDWWWLMMINDDWWWLTMIDDDSCTRNLLCIHKRIFCVYTRDLLCMHNTLMLWAREPRGLGLGLAQAPFWVPGPWVPLPRACTRVLCMHKRSLVYTQEILLCIHKRFLVHESSSIIINHHQSSLIIINHHQSSSIIINHHQSSLIIINHH